MWTMLFIKCWSNVKEDLALAYKWTNHSAPSNRNTGSQFLKIPIGQGKYLEGKFPVLYIRES